jgi:hypothetical protein
MVWDNDNGRPVIFNRSIISGRTEFQARTLAKLVSKIYATRCDARSIREMLRSNQEAAARSGESNEAV